MPIGICRIGIRQPIERSALKKVCLTAFAESEFGNPFSFAESEFGNPQSKVVNLLFLLHYLGLSPPFWFSSQSVNLCVHLLCCVISVRYGFATGSHYSKEKALKKFLANTNCIVSKRIWFFWQ